MRWTMPVDIVITYAAGHSESYADRVTFTTMRGRRRALRSLEMRTRRAHLTWSRIEYTFGRAWAPAPRANRDAI
jgi:hypothetical protein